MTFNGSSILCKSFLLPFLRNITIDSVKASASSILGARRYTTDSPSDTILSKKIPSFNVCHIDVEGRKAVYDVAKTTFYNELGLTARDLRFQHTHMLSARNGKMIIRIQKLKAVICPNAVLIIDSPSSTANTLGESDFCQSLPQMLFSNQLHTEHLPFEYKVLEAILSHSTQSMNAEINILEPIIRDILDTLTDPTNQEVDRSLVHVLLQNNSKLNRFSTTVKEYCQLFHDLLEYDDDIKELCISVQHNDFTGSSDSFHVFVYGPQDESLEEQKAASGNHLQKSGIRKKYRINLLEEMEMLIDYFLKEAEDLSNKVSELKQAIDDSNSAILINLDINLTLAKNAARNLTFGKEHGPPSFHRNLLLKLELHLTMGMFSCTYFGMIGMAFGMNLNSSLEENSFAFWLVSGTMFMGAGICWIMLVTSLHKGPEYILGTVNKAGPAYSSYVAKNSLAKTNIKETKT